MPSPPKRGSSCPEKQGRGEAKRWSANTAECSRDSSRGELRARRGAGSSGGTAPPGRRSGRSGSAARCRPCSGSVTAGRAPTPPGRTGTLPVPLPAGRRGREGTAPAARQRPSPRGRRGSPRCAGTGRAGCGAERRRRTRGGRGSAARTRSFTEGRCPWRSRRRGPAARTLRCTAAGHPTPETIQEPSRGGRQGGEGHGRTRQPGGTRPWPFCLPGRRK